MRVHVGLTLSAWTLAMRERQSWPNVRAKALRSSRRYKDFLARWRPAVSQLHPLLRILSPPWPVLSHLRSPQGVKQSQETLTYGQAKPWPEHAKVGKAVRNGSKRSRI